MPINQCGNFFLKVMTQRITSTIQEKIRFPCHWSLMRVNWFIIHQEQAKWFPVLVKIIAFIQVLIQIVMLENAWSMLKILSWVPWLYNRNLKETLKNFFFCYGNMLLYTATLNRLVYLFQSYTCVLSMNVSAIS